MGYESNALLFENKTISNEPLTSLTSLFYSHIGNKNLELKDFLLK